MTSSERQETYDATDQLYQALPAIYREKDQDEDLRNYLGGFGVVLDQIRKTLWQRLDDISPRTCQEWLLPYFADLLDVRPLSPDMAGRREEIARAVRWRQRKGSVSVCVEVAEAVGQAPIIGFEGHRSVARTPWPGRRQPTLRELGEEEWRPRPAIPSHLAKRPGTPAVTLDFRKRSAPRRTDGAPPTPQSETSRFAEQEVQWQHESPPHGLTCDPREYIDPETYLDPAGYRGHGGYRDIAPRTVDLRDPSWSTGHHHPKRFRLFTPLPEGFLSQDDSAKIPRAVAKALMTPMAVPAAAVHWTPVDVEQEERIYLKRYEAPISGAPAGGPAFVRIEQRLLPPNGPKADNVSKDLRLRSTLLTLPRARLEELIGGLDWTSDWDEIGFLLQWERSFDPVAKVWHTTLRGGTWDLARRAAGLAGQKVEGRQHLRHPERWPTITGNLEIKALDPDHVATVSRLVLPDRLNIKARRAVLSRLGARKVVLNTAAGPKAEVTARDCLLLQLGGGLGTVELEYCTLDSPLACEELRASDCILLGKQKETDRLRLRYCCVPRIDLEAAGDDWKIHWASVHSRWPALHHQGKQGTEPPRLDPAKFGQRGYGVLRQSAHPTIRQGAEDGGELGAFHHRHYCGRQDAVEEKLIEFLPVGLRPVLIVDENWRAPIERHSP